MVQQDTWHRQRAAPYRLSELVGCLTSLTCFLIWKMELIRLVLQTHLKPYIK